jgi:hypothetical protein
MTMEISPESGVVERYVQELERPPTSPLLPVLLLAAIDVGCTVTSLLRMA